jgi:hypothetical protein
MDDALGHVCGGTYVFGAELAGSEVSVLREGAIPANVLCLGQVFRRNNGGELVAGVFEDNPVGTLPAAGAKAGGRHVSSDGLADGVVTGCHRERRVVSGEKPRRPDVAAGVVHAFTGRRHVGRHPIEVPDGERLG